MSRHVYDVMQYDLISEGSEQWKGKARIDLIDIDNI